METIGELKSSCESLALNLSGHLGPVSCRLGG